MRNLFRKRKILILDVDRQRLLWFSQKKITPTQRADWRAPDMKQRFSISRNTGGEQIVIKEYAELDKGVYSLLCEESYAIQAVQAALAKGPGYVITLLRTESFFPTSYFAEKLTASLDAYLKQENGDPINIEADDAECIRNLGKDMPAEENGRIEDLLDVDGDDIVEDDQPVEKLDAPIKIAEDETAEVSNSL